MKFENPEHRISDLKIEEGKNIGSGSFSNIYEVQVTVGDKVKPMILKRFKDNDLGTPSENAQRAFGNYALAKRVGLKVFPTYRLSEDKQSILMTDAGKDADFCSAANNTLHDVRRIEKIENIKGIIQDLLGQARIASDNGITLLYDVPLFTIDKETRSKLDFYLGDFDLISRDSEKARALRHNLDHLCAALTVFIQRYVAQPELYLPEIERAFGIDPAKDIPGPF
jgi:hypothetical protein